MIRGIFLCLIFPLILALVILPFAVAGFSIYAWYFTISNWNTAPCVGECQDYTNEEKGMDGRWHIVNGQNSGLPMHVLYLVDGKGQSVWENNLVSVKIYDDFLVMLTSNDMPEDIYIGPVFKYEGGQFRGHTRVLVAPTQDELVDLIDSAWGFMPEGTTFEQFGSRVMAVINDGDFDFLKEVTISRNGDGAQLAVSANSAPEYVPLQRGFHRDIYLGMGSFRVTNLEGSSILFITGETRLQLDTHNSITTALFGRMGDHQSTHLNVEAIVGWGHFSNMTPTFRLEGGPSTGWVFGTSAINPVHMEVLNAGNALTTLHSPPLYAKVEFFGFNDIPLATVNVVGRGERISPFEIPIPPTMHGFVFMGWYNSNNKVPTSIVTANASFYAIYNPVGYTPTPPDNPSDNRPPDQQPTVTPPRDVGITSISDFEWQHWTMTGGIILTVLGLGIGTVVLIRRSI